MKTAATPEGHDGRAARPHWIEGPGLAGARHGAQRKSRPRKGPRRLLDLLQLHF
jgi:hypothetical protein